MSSRKLIWDPEHWRFRAEETRTVADQMTHEESRTIMRRIALDYDRLAQPLWALRGSFSEISHFPPSNIYQSGVV